jgi:hypothetical protein
VIQEKAFIAEKKALNTPKFHLDATTLCFNLEIGVGSGILAVFLFQIETQFGLCIGGL